MSLEALYRKLNKAAVERERQALERERESGAISQLLGKRQASRRGVIGTIKGMKRAKHSVGLLKRRYGG